MDSEELLALSILGSFYWQVKAAQSSPSLLFLFSGRRRSWSYFISPKQKVCTPYLTPCLSWRLGRMFLGHHYLSCDWRLKAGVPKVTMLLWFTTIPSLKSSNNKKVTWSRLYVATAQSLKAFKGQDHFIGQKEVVFGSSGQQLPVLGEKSIAQHSLLKVSGPRGQEASQKISVYFSYFIYLGRSVIFKLMCYTIQN